MSFNNDKRKIAIFTPPLNKKNPSGSALKVQKPERHENGTIWNQAQHQVEQGGSVA